MKKITLAVIIAVGSASLTFGTTYQSVASDDWNVTTTWTPAGTPASGDTVVIRNHDVSLTSSTTINDLKTWGGGGSVGSLTINNATLTTGTAPDYLAGTANNNSAVTLNGGSYNPGGIVQIQSGAADNHNSALTLNSGSSLTTGGTGDLRMNAGSGSINTVVLNGGSTMSVQFIDFNNLGDGSTVQQVLVNDGTLTLRAANEFGALQFDDVDATVMFEAGSIVFKGVDSLEDFGSFVDQFNIWVNAGNVDSVAFSDAQLKANLIFDGTDAVLVPEPGTLGLLALSAGALMFFRRRHC